MYTLTLTGVDGDGQSVEVPLRKVGTHSWVLTLGPQHAGVTWDVVTCSRVDRDRLVPPSLVRTGEVTFVVKAGA